MAVSSRNVGLGLGALMQIDSLAADKPGLGLHPEVIGWKQLLGQPSAWSVFWRGSGSKPGKQVVNRPELVLNQNPVSYFGGA